MNNKTVSSPISGGNNQAFNLSSLIIVFALGVLSALVAVSLPRLVNSNQTGIEANVSSLSANPELKTLTYATVYDSVPDLGANPELKVLAYPVVDKAAVQIIGGSEPRVLQFPEAMDDSHPEYANPELKFLNYAQPIE